MPQIDISGSDSKLSCDKLQGQSGTTVNVLTGHTLAIADAGGLTVNGSAVSATSSQYRNDIINGGLVVNQENQTAPADDVYTIGDLFLHVGEGTPVMSLETDGPQGTRPWQKMVLDSNAQGGLVYFMSNDDVQDYIANGKLSFGVQLKTTSATISNARIGILKWTGTADTVTSDVVGTWASDGTNPTLATSWSYENTPANIGLTTSWARHTVENVTVDSDTKNIAIFIWTNDGTITASDVIGFSEWQCNPGSTVNDFSTPDYATVQNQVWYYIERQTYDGDGNEMIHQGRYHNTTTALFDMTWKARKRLAATTISTSAATGFSVSDHSGLFAASNMGSQNNGGRWSDRFTITVATTSAAAGDTTTLVSESAGNWIQIDTRF